MASFNVNNGMKCNGTSVVGCGILFIDTNASVPLPVIASINNLAKFNYASKVDSVIVYNGYKIICYTDTAYGTVGTVYTYDNTDGSTMQIYTPTVNTIKSCKVYYKGNEIILNGISNNTTPA